MEYRIKFEPGEFERCQAFAEEAVLTSDYYECRGQSDPLKAIRQTREGKLGELIVYRHLHDHGVTVETPDFQVYKTGKSWSPDLLVHIPGGGTIPIAVKSQNIKIQERCGASWVFNYADNKGVQSPSHTDELFHPQYQNTLIVPVTLLNEGGIIRAAVLAKDVMSEVEKALPVSDSLKKSKRILYGTYLVTLPEEKRWRWPFNKR